jgi:hypothetical protein
MNTKEYHCPDCKHVLSARIPSRRDASRRGYWDYLVHCPGCGRMIFCVVYPDRRVIIYPVDEMGILERRKIVY